MKRTIRVNPGFVLIASSAIALALAACVKEGDDAPPLPGVLGGLMTAAGGTAGTMGMSGAGGGAGQGGSSGGGGSAGTGMGQGGSGGSAGSGTLPDAGGDGGPDGGN